MWQFGFLILASTAPKSGSLSPPLPCMPDCGTCTWPWPVPSSRESRTLPWCSMCAVVLLSLMTLDHTDLICELLRAAATCRKAYWWAHTILLWPVLVLQPDILLVSVGKSLCLGYGFQENINTFSTGGSQTFQTQRSFSCTWIYVSLPIACKEWAIPFSSV